MKIKIVSLLAVGIMLLTAISFSGCALFDKEEEPIASATGRKSRLRKRKSRDTSRDFGARDGT